jgi:hypothetical protein
VRRDHLLLRVGRRELCLLTVSEIFRLETRALCIAFFYAIGPLPGVSQARSSSVLSS